ncbi:hypothetical protein CXG46_07700 [Nocardioides alpinus]|uniref:Uncharacterized protein n=1 Tax=Nocardioides alpinus TaxID=748909 RepID=A0ABX4QY49_9ACTN|nr:hypothetical protein CXG46_07700 [Nocardioides alpinus]
MILSTGVGLDDPVARRDGTSAESAALRPLRDTKGSRVTTPVALDTLFAEVAGGATSAPCTPIATAVPVASNARGAAMKPARGTRRPRGRMCLCLGFLRATPFPFLLRVAGDMGCERSAADPIY